MDWNEPGRRYATVQEMHSTRRIPKRSRYATFVGSGHLGSGVSELSGLASFSEESEEIPKNAFTRAQ